MNELKELVQAGNIKIPRTTAIFNMSSATDCPSLKLGLCSAVDANGKLFCYARKAEYAYRPQVLPYRRRQEKFWKSVSAESFVKQFIDMNKGKKTKFNAIRFNEAGDFHSQKCVDKTEKIATLLKVHKIKCYMYTSRKDLNYKKVNNLVISGSGWMKDNVTNDFKIVEKGEKLKGYTICPMDCKICKRCMIKGTKTAVVKH